MKLVPVAIRRRSAERPQGLGCDELTVPLELRAGENCLVVKLQRFWERRWMFCASLSDRMAP
ncbi:MAG: hypothetical protein NTY19_48315 [Planctomycetota bacterium]|nr:hypothetical protein [Planctomycetota bacterium]